MRVIAQCYNRVSDELSRYIVIIVLPFVELGVLRACSTALSGGTYSEAVSSSGRLAGSTEGFLTTAEVSNVLREAEAPL